MTPLDPLDGVGLHGGVATRSRIGILTSGGDAPGMNAALRAAARVGLELGYGIYGVACAYDPYVALTSLDQVLAETERLVRGESPLAMWRKRIFRETEGMPAR